MLGGFQEGYISGFEKALIGMCGLKELSTIIADNHHKDPDVSDEEKAVVAGALATFNASRNQIN